MKRQKKHISHGGGCNKTNYVSAFKKRISALQSEGYSLDNPHMVVGNLKLTSVLTRQVAVAKINGTKQVVSIVNKEDFEKMRLKGDLGTMDYDEAVRNGDIFFGWSMGMESDGYSLDAPVSLTFDNGTEEFQYSGNVAGAFVSADTYWVMPEEVYESMNHEGNSYGYIWIDCAEQDAASVEQSLNNLLGNTSHVEMKSYHDELRTADMASQMMKLGCYLFMAIVGLIGFMNLANTMIINITTRNRNTEYYRQLV